jgi:hypothetical protein
VKTILFANTSLLTGDDIALAVLHYSGALAEAGLAETIEIPVIEPDGSPGTALLLVGPASQIVAVDAPSVHEELRDPDAVADLHRKTQTLRPVALTEADPPDGTWIEEI